jgi:lipopolysaccharide heptosyltransferase II
MALAYNAPKMEIKKILFFKPGAIGDLLQSLPALKAIRQKFPSAHITIMVSPGIETLVQGTSVADRVQVFDKSKLKQGLRGLIDFGLQLRRERYDLFVDMQTSLRSKMMRFLSGAPLTLGYKKQRRHGPKTRRLHAGENFLETLRPLGISGPLESIELPVTSAAKEAVGRFLAAQRIDMSRPLVALNCSVGAARPARNWFPERFAELADRLIQELGANVVFVGSGEDQALVSGVMAAMRTKALSATGELPLDQSAALLAQCKCVVSSDTGPLHLATAVQTPVVGLYGSTDPLRTGPIGAGHQVLIKKLPCVPCEKKDCPLGTRACMADISVAEVFDAVRSVI